MITSLIAGLSILLLTGLTNSYISYWLFVEHPKHEQNKSS
ncbi:MAG: hypothetical protein RLZZ29_1222 [Cyanobacteriota bacterium]|jgi:hypothetical protein|uniref:Uncharacterized protein n=1 Tax=Sphaerospermopsis reniformis TaxID=531300 RepID=A0A479ZWB5_9CYAN|nr:hypothetical protein NIES73_22320 [Sphaerospermopsis kisseleviana NIES-73]GCL36787.1 hypothetical protein SR1949_18930 [Sphaerospermopsis reniformis]